MRLHDHHKYHKGSFFNGTPALFWEVSAAAVSRKLRCGSQQYAWETRSTAVDRWTGRQCHPHHAQPPWHKRLVCRAVSYSGVELAEAVTYTTRACGEQPTFCVQRRPCRCSRCSISTSPSFLLHLLQKLHGPRTFQHKHYSITCFRPDRNEAVKRSLGTESRARAKSREQGDKESCCRWRDCQNGVRPYSVFLQQQGTGEGYERTSCPLVSPQGYESHRQWVWTGRLHQVAQSSRQVFYRSPFGTRMIFK